MTAPDLQADLHRQLQFAERLLERSQALQQDLSELTGSCEALDGRVRATVDNAGRPVGLTIEPRAMRTGSEELAQAVLAAFTTAHDHLAGQSQRLLTALRDDLPDQLRDPLGSGVVHDLAEHSREVTRTLQTSNDPGGDALHLARDLSARVLRGI
jgi:DNA-binding protein YbaB